MDDRLTRPSAEGPTPSHALAGARILENPAVVDLLQARSIAALGTIEPDGAPHVVAVWFAHEAGRLIVATGSSSRKVANVRRDPRATLMLHDSGPGFDVRGASIVTEVEVVGKPDADRLIDRVHERYLREDASKIGVVGSFLESDDVALLLRPVRALLWNERGSAAALALAKSGLALPLGAVAGRMDDGYFDSGSSL